MTTRTCPVKSCTLALGTTRHGDPFVLCPRHYHSLTRVQQQRLWQAYMARKRLEKQRLRIRAETGEVSKGLLAAIAAAVSEYIDVRDDCIASLARHDEQQLEMAQ